MIIEKLCLKWFNNASLLAAGLDIVTKRKRKNKMLIKIVLLACLSFRFNIVV